MVLTRLMATTNNVQEDEPPRPTTLERQVQTLAVAVKRLTKQNHDLEEQLRQRDAGTAPNEGDLKGQRAVTSPADPNDGT